MQWKEAHDFATSLISAYQRCNTANAPHPGLHDAFVFVAPDNEVQKVRKVVLADGVLAACRVLHAVLVQHEDVEPLLQRICRAVCWSHPADRYDR